MTRSTSHRVHQRIKLLIHRALRQVAAKLRQHALLAAIALAACAAGAFSCVVRCSSSRIAGSRSRAPSESPPQSTFLPAAIQQQMLRPNMFMREPLRLFGSVGQYPLALVRERQIDRSRYLLRIVVCPSICFVSIPPTHATQKPVRQCFIFAQQPEQQVLGLDISDPN